MLLLCYVNQPLLYFCVGAQIRMLSQRNLLTAASIRKLWKINDWRNDILHRYQRDHLSNPEAFKSAFKIVTQEILEKSNAKKKHVYQEKINEILTLHDPGVPVTVTDCDLVIRITKFVEHIITKYYHLSDELDITLGT